MLRGYVPARRVFAETARELALARHVRQVFKEQWLVCVGPWVGDAGIEPASAASETTCRPSNPQWDVRESNPLGLCKRQLCDRYINVPFFVEGTGVEPASSNLKGSRSAD